MPATTTTRALEVTLHEDTYKALESVMSTTGMTADRIIARSLRASLPRILAEYHMPFTETEPPTLRPKQQRR